MGPMSLRQLFPPLEPYIKGALPVDGLHTLYWEESGNPDGVPVVFLHGGPGAGASATHRRFFDPASYRIIIFDQRGAGRSRPLGETRQNNINLLISDIEMLRRDRGVERWHVFGGSWGSTLALAYAETHPERCLSLTLRGIFLLRQMEIDWFLYGIRNVFPEAWDKFSGLISPDERHDLLAAYTRLFESTDEEIRMNAMRSWSLYESSCSTLHPGEGSNALNDQYHMGLAKLESHYFTNNKFTPESWLLDHVDRIRHIPASIIQGRYDMVCPIVSANELHERWPEAEYRVIADAGHSALETGIRSALIEATEKFKAIKG